MDGGWDVGSKLSKMAALFIEDGRARKSKYIVEKWSLRVNLVQYTKPLYDTPFLVLLGISMAP